MTCIVVSASLSALWIASAAAALADPVLTDRSDPCAGIQDPEAAYLSSYRQRGGASALAWESPTGFAPRGVFALIHGAGGANSDLQYVARELRKLGFSTLRITLAGHGGELYRQAEIDRHSLVRGGFLGLCIAQRKARELGVPWYVAGYSLGGLVIQDVLNLEMAQGFDPRAALLFAPALALRPFGDWIKLLYPLGKGFQIPPSFTGTTIKVSVLKAMRESQRIVVSRSGFSKTRSLPTWVIMDRQDPLIDDRRVERILLDQRLDAWRFLEVQLPRNPSQHLVVMPHHYHPREWERLWLQIAIWLEQQ